jgi:hypothetical protein
VEPIEQILGWTPSVHHVPGSLRIGWVRTDGTWVQVSTADDLAAWLDQHTDGWEIERDSPDLHGDDDWLVWVAGCATGYSRPTIFGALEAAVRHVHATRTKAK